MKRIFFRQRLMWSYALIMTYHDAETFLSGIEVKAECGMVSFDELTKETT